MRIRIRNPATDLAVRICECGRNVCPVHGILRAVHSVVAPVLLLCTGQHRSVSFHAILYRNGTGTFNPGPTVLTNRVGDPDPNWIRIQSGGQWIRIRDSESGSGIRNPDPGFGIRDSESGIWNPGFGIRNSGFGIRIRDSESRSGIRNPDPDPGGKK
jgi:hypothetical protein